MRTDVVREAMVCPVCNKHKFSEYDSFEICPVCGWEDDAVATRHPDLEGGANSISLNEYRKKEENR